MTILQPNILFSLEAFHSYFNNNLCTCLRFIPGLATAVLQRRFGFLIHPKTNGFEFYTASATDTDSFLKYARDTTGYSFFDFNIETTDPAFYCFTRLPANWKGQLNYDSKDQVAESGKRVIGLKEKLSENKSTAIAGTVLIRFDDITGETGAPRFIIRLTARSTQWQYFFINNSAVHLEKPVITGNGTIKFDGPETVTIPSGQQALFFSSGSSLLPLSERPAYSFSLVNRVTPRAGDLQRVMKNRVIIKSLPFPDPVQYGSVQVENEDQFSSPMYVFI